MIGSASAIDRFYHYLLTRQTGGVSPAGLWLSYLDWAVHLSLAPGTQAKLAWRAMSDAIALQHYVASVLESGDGKAHCVDPAPSDRRFAHPEWERWPFNVLQQSFLLCEGWWDEATRNIRGVSAHHAAPVNFAARQLLDMVSPSNFLPTNPEVLERTVQEGGANLIRGFHNFVEDLQRTAAGLPPVGVDAFKVGKNIAITPGKVIARTRLMELIQYSPATKTVHPDPVLIVPAWIMKYYVLDLSPNNSLVKYLVDQGFTVFMISWKNPDESYHDCGMDDYRRLGIMEALRAISQVLPERKVHALGYCLGGTLLTIAAAAMARDGDDRIKTLTLLAAQTDFSQPGELQLFVGDSTLVYLEDIMEEVGYLEGSQMAATFQLLRSNDLIWSRMLRDYLLGERQQIIDMMAWNARRHAHAGADAFRISAENLLRKPACARPVLCRRPRHRASQHIRPNFRGRHRDRSRRAMAVGVPDQRARRHGRHFPPHERRAQCRHRVGAGPQEPSLPRRHIETSRSLHRPG